MNPWNREPDDDADNSEILTETCRRCGRPCRVEDDFCPPCWQQHKGINDEIVTRAIANWMRRADEASW